MNDQREQRTLTTADLAAAADPATRMPEERADARSTGAYKAAQNADGNEQLAALFTPEIATDFRNRWNAVQSSFVDDPKDAVRHGDELVAQVMKSLAETFSNERTRLEEQFQNADQTSTEELRLAFRRYRSFFERLLSL